MPQPFNRPIKPPATHFLKGRYILAAVIAHALLFLALSLNMQWRSESPPPAMAELWVELPTTNTQQQHQTSAPVRPQEQETPPDTALADTEIALAEIRRQEAIEAEKRRLAEEALQRQQAEIQRLQREQEQQRQQEEANRQRLERQRIEQERLAAERQARQKQAERERQAAEEKAKQEQAERERLAAEEKARQEAERKRQAAEEKARQEEEKRKREAAERERIRQEQLRHIQGLAGGEGNSNSGATGQPGGSGNSNAAYVSRLASIVRRNISFTGDRSTKPTAHVYVETDRNGKITTVRLTKSSGNTTWDDAAIRGIWKTETLPPDTNGKRPTMQFNFILTPE